MAQSEDPRPRWISYQSAEFVRQHSLELLTLGTTSQHQNDIERALWDTTLGALRAHGLLKAEGDGYYHVTPQARTAAEQYAPSNLLPCKCTGFTNSAGHVQCTCGHITSRDQIKRCLFNGGGE